MKVTCCPSCGSSFASWSASAKILNKQPLVLKCGHTFCEACVGQKTRKITTSNHYQAQVTCPTCKINTFLENGIKDLPVNVYLSAYIEINQRNKLDKQLTHGLGQFVLANKFPRPDNEIDVKEGKCKMCVNKSATCKCAECDSFLCIGCFEKVHSMSAAIRHHKPIPTTVIKRVVSNESEPKCAEHDRVLEYFCEDDSSSICSRCYIIGKHQNHSILSFEEINKHVLEDIGNELPSARLVLEKLNKIDRKIVSAMPNIKTEAKSLIEDINYSFLRLHSLIQAREMEVIKDVYSAYKDHIISLDKQRETFEKVRSELEDAVRKADKLFDNTALLLDGRALHEALKKARTIPCIAVKADVSKEGQLQWHETQDDNLTALINTYGSISGSPPLKLDFKTIEEAPDCKDDDDNLSIISLGSESSIQSVGGTVSVPGNISSVDTGEDVIIECEDTDADSEVSRERRSFKWEHITLPVIKGPAQKVVVTHIRSPSDFCAQLVCNRRQLETLAHNMNIWCRRNKSLKHVPVLIEKDMLLLARYSADKQWYRAQVMDVEKPKVKEDNYKVHVKYIDFGNDELVPRKELRIMQERFLKYPVFAVQCSLFDIAPSGDGNPWCLEAVQEFHKMTQNQTLMMSVFGKQGAVYEVDLVCIPMSDALDDNYVSVRDILIFLGLAYFKTFSDAAINTCALPAYPKIDFIKPTAVKNGSTLEVIVTQMTSPCDFHLVRIGEEHEYYLIMQEEMQQMYEKDLCNIYSLFYPRTGMVCAAKGDDGKWHRAKVASTPMNKQVPVSFVDLGTTQVIRYDHLKKLHSSFIKLPIQAIPCHLMDICPVAGPTSEWSEEAKLWCQTNLAGGMGKARFTRRGQNTQVVLWMQTLASEAGPENINYKLVELGFAQSTGPSSVKGADKSQTSPYQSVIKNGDNISRKVPFQKASNPSLAEKQIKTDTRTQTQSPQPGTAELTLKILSKPSGTRKTYHTETEKNTSSRKQNVSIDERAAEERNQTQLEIHKAMSPEGSPTKLESGTSYIEVVVCNYVSPSEFYVQVLETQKDLIKLMNDMQAMFNDSQPSASINWTVNTYCTARYSADGLWYRGKIISKVSEDEYQIEYIDYGNVDTVKTSDLRPLPREFGNRLPCASARCHLANLLPAGSNDITKWSQTAIEFMASLIKDRKLYIKQEGDPTETGLPVDLILEEEIPETAFEPKRQSYHSVRRAVVKNGLAMPTKTQSAPPTPDAGMNPFQRIIFMSEIGSGDQVSVVANTNPDGGLVSTVAAEGDDDKRVDVAPAKLEPYQVSTLTLPSYPLPEPGDEETVVPTFVDAEGVIYAQPLSWEGKCAHISYELQRIYVNMSLVGNIEWQIGQICVALFPDDSLWYRAKIRDIRDDRVKVQYIDFGNSTWVKASQLHEMLPVFAEEHPLAYRCVLYDLEPMSPSKKWPVEVLSYIHKMIVNQTCIITVVEADGTLLKVQLLRDDFNVCEDLISRNLAVSLSGIQTLCEQSSLIGQVLANENPYHQLDVGGVGDTFKAILIHMEFPDVIYLQRGLEIEPEGSDFVKASEVAKNNNSIREFVEMAERLKVCKSMPMSHLPDVGLMCAALFSADNQLYRALCVKCFPETDSCLVVFVDYGTSEVVPRKRLRLLPTEFWSIPAQAIRCYIGLSSVTDPAIQLNHHLFVDIIKSLTEKEVMAKIVLKNPLTVELMVEDGGMWKVPYKHLLVDQMSKLVSAGILERGEELSDIILEDLNEEQNNREKWNDSSDDDDDSLVASQRVRTQVKSESRHTNLMTEKCKDDIVVQGEDDLSSAESDDDDVDWVAVAAKLVESKFDCEGVKEISEIGKQ